jgi:hypothetical protein
MRARADEKGLGFRVAYSDAAQGIFEGDAGHRFAGAGDDIHESGGGSAVLRPVRGHGHLKFLHRIFPKNVRNSFAAAGGSKEPRSVERSNKAQHPGLASNSKFQTSSR